MDKFRGLNGTIVLKEDCVQILREKVLDSTFHEQEKIEIPYSEIKDVYLKAVKDDTSVVFRMFKNGEAERFAEEIRKRI